MEKHEETCHPELVSGSINVGESLADIKPILTNLSQNDTQSFCSAESYKGKEVGKAPSPNLGEGRGEVKRKFGFTLAEVLITLAIVGVVAALTMPALINKCQDMVLGNQRKAATSKISQALGVLYAREQLGEIADADAMATELSKIMNVAKVCKKGDISGCFADEIAYAKNNSNSTTDQSQQLDQEKPRDPILDLLTSAFTPPVYAALSNKLTLLEGVSSSLKRDELSLNLYADSKVHSANDELAGIVLNDGTSMLFMYNPDCNFSGVTETGKSKIVQNTMSATTKSGLTLNPSLSEANRKVSSVSTTVLPSSKDQRACFGAIIDANGLKKKPNTFDKDVFHYQASSINDLLWHAGQAMLQDAN